MPVRGIEPLKITRGGLVILDRDSIHVERIDVAGVDSVDEATLDLSLPDLDLSLVSINRISHRSLLDQLSWMDQ